MGTASFAVPSLKILLDNGFVVKAVVTAPDKPAGRGRKIRYSPVKEFALMNHLPLLQPLKLNDPKFITELKTLNANLQIVVAFRMLPRSVWQIPSHGTFNLHASLLPQYRGAAPINHALINGEKHTGVSTFFIDEKIDTGQLIAQKEVAIGPDETAGELHDRLMMAGAELVLETVRLIQENKHQSIHQDRLISSNDTLKPAPKIFREDCRINWKQKVIPLHNFIRGLSPYPAAHCFLGMMNDTKKMMKVFRVKPVESNDVFPDQNFKTDGRTYFNVQAKDGFVSVLEVQLEGKKKMPIADFLRGFSVETVKSVD